MAGVIDDYVGELRRELSFDPPLAQRLASEIEDHLREAAEADPAWPSGEAERRAVERFGLSREIAAQFAVDAVDREARRTWVTLVATVVITLIAMRLRAVWLDDGAIIALAPLIDRYAFIAAMAAGVVGWFAFRRSVMAPALCLAGLGASIAAGFVRADLFTDGAPLSVLLTAAGEVALVGLLFWRVVGLGQRLRCTAMLRGAGR